MKNNNYDSIIIGSGVGGLTLAALLTHEAKQKVLVLEKRDVPGGYATHFDRKGYKFNVSLHITEGLSPGNVFWDIFNKCRITDKVEFLRPKEMLQCFFPDLEVSVPECTIETYKRRLIQIFPHEKENILNLFDTLMKINNEALSIGWSGLPTMLEILIFSFRYTDLLRYSQKPVSDLLSGIKDQKLKGVIGLTWGLSGLPPSKLSAAFFALSLILILNKGTYSVKGGVENLVSAFVSSIEEGGSKLMLSSPVKKILLEGGKAVGVETESGGRFFAKNIISNVCIPSTVFQLVGEENFPQPYINKIKSQITSLSAFSVYLGVDLPPAEIGTDNYEIGIYPNYDPEAQYEAAVKGDFNNVPLLVTLYSKIDKSMAPQGKSTITIVTLSEYDVWKNLSAEDYKKKKEEAAQILIKRVGKYLPKMLDHIEVREIATPLTMERYTGNYKGAIYGYAQTVEQARLKRIPQATPIKNLFYVGAWTYPGGSYMGCVQSAYELFSRYITK